MATIKIDDSLLNDERFKNFLEALSSLLKPVAEAPKKRKLEVFKPAMLSELWAALDPETIKLWQDLYPDAEYRRRECMRCWDYYKHAEKKRPTTLQGWRKVFGSWLNSNWAKHQASQPGPGGRFNSHGPAPIRYPDADKVLAEQSTEPELTDEERKAAAQRVRELIAQTGNLGKRGAS